MAKAFDTTLKDMFNVYPQDVLNLLQLNPQDSISNLPTNLTANIDTDLVLGLGQPLRAVIDVNFQVEWDEETPRKLFAYNALLHRTHIVSVHSVLVMLRSRGNDLRLDSGIRYSVFPDLGHMEFRPQVVRVWERPVEEFLTSGLGMLPLASLAEMPEGLTREQAMPEILRRIAERLRTEASSEQADRLLNWTYTLAGLHFSGAQMQTIMRRTGNVWSDILEKSATYQDMLKRYDQGLEQGLSQGQLTGRLSQVHETLLLLGQDKFGAPDKATANAITSLTDIDLLNRMTRAILKANSWAELLQTK